MEEHFNHNENVVGSSPSTSTIVYTKSISIQGYNLGYPYFIDYDHPLAADNSGRVLLHRHVASVKYGRWLSSEDVVHHVDENKENYAEDNLVVLTKSEHSILHNLNKITEKACKGCNNIFLPKKSRIEYCSQSCFRSSSVKNKNLTKEILDDLIPTTTWTDLAKMFGYGSANGIKARAIKLGCDISKSKRKYIKHV